MKTFPSAHYDMWVCGRTSFRGMVISLIYIGYCHRLLLGRNKNIGG